MSGSPLLERRFRTMGTEVRVLIGGPVDAGLADPEAMAAEVERELLDFDRRLSRFRPDSELSALNGDPRDEVPVSALLLAALRAGIWAAERTGGLVDPTVLPALEAAGYTTSRDGVRSAPLEEALSAAPSRAPARPDPRALWRSIELPPDAGLVRRPPGLRFDTGGTGKGLAADLLASRLEGYARFVIDCGGDMRVGGREPAGEPLEIEIRHPKSGQVADTFAIATGAVATSGLDARLWELPGGGHAHHLIDPATGRPAWTGLVGATARAPTALEADVLAKAALLSGREGAHGFLAEHGGLIVRDDGEVERIGPLHDRRRVRIALPR